MTAPRYAIGRAIVTRTDIGVDAQARCGTIADAVGTVKTINRTEGGVHGIMDDENSMLIAVAFGGEIFHRSIEDGRFCPHCGRGMADGHKAFCPLASPPKAQAHLCPDCGGDGFQSYEIKALSHLCPDCGGDGYQSYEIGDDEPCHLCGGSGKSPL